jgi:hypothetical protein
LRLERSRKECGIRIRKRRYMLQNGRKELDHIEI